MNTATIASQVRVAARFFKELDAAVFTTFAFSSDFFEESVLPAVLAPDEETDGPASHTRRPRNRAAVQMLVHQRLAEVPVSVYYDPTARIRSGGHYRYSAHAVPVPGQFFHPKNIILSGTDAAGNDLVFVSVSSANLTLSGWGRNSEVFAQTWVHSTKQQSWSELSGFLRWLADRTSAGVVPGSFDALQRVLGRLNRMTTRRLLSNTPRRPWTGTQYDRLYFSPLHAEGFARFFRRKHRPWKMTVVAPYWHSPGKQLVPFSPWEVELVPTLLPKTPATSALMADDVAEARELLKGGCDKVAVSKIADDDGTRFWHAKAYLLAYMKSADVAVGSCNFTEAGLAGSTGNVESMLVRHVGRETALIPVTTEAPESHFATTAELEEDTPRPAPVDLVVVFDWSTMTYAWRYQASRSATSSILELPGKVRVAVENGKGSYLSTAGPTVEATFTLHYTLGPERRSWSGLIAELNLDASERNYGISLRVSDILDSWKGAHLAKVGTWSTFVAEAGEAEGDDNAPGDDAEPLFDALNLYDIYRAFWDVRHRLNVLSKEGDAHGLHSLLVSRPDSVLALMRITTKAKGAETIRYLVLGEIRDILTVYGGSALELHVARLEGLRRHLRGTLKDQLKSGTADAEATLAWFEDEFDAAWRTE